MSEKNKIRDSDEEDDDGDYCPTTHDHEQSDASEESATHDDDDDKEEEKQSIKPFDESKADELWKNFTSSTKPSAPIIKESPKVTTTKVYDYAGEKVQVPTTTSSSLKRPAAPSMGSGSVLDRLGIGKKPKLSTLEKSRLDWDTYKETESITDDMNIHRRSKDSYFFNDLSCHLDLDTCLLSAETLYVQLATHRDIPTSIANILGLTNRRNRSLLSSSSSSSTPGYARKVQTEQPRGTMNLDNSYFREDSEQSLPNNRQQTTPVMDDLLTMTPLIEL